MTTIAPAASSARDIDTQHILVVDDEPAVVAGLRRQLFGDYIVHTATDPLDAVAKIERSEGRLAVIISDMQMPRMNGAQLLARARALTPDTTRILLTGHADLDAAIDAVNEGQIFRFLWKPCPPEAMQACLRDAVAQYRLVTAERVLLERTLSGAVKALIDTLALANPIAFARAERLHRRAIALTEHLDPADRWAIRVAVMLSQLGAVTLPHSVAERLHRGDPLTDSQQTLVRRMPGIALDLLGDVPRLETVRDIIRWQDQRDDGRGPVEPGVPGGAFPFGAQLLRVLLDYDALEAAGTPADDAIGQLRTEHGRYSPAVLELLEAVETGDALPGTERIDPEGLEVGMILAADLLTTDGVLLAGKGQEVTDRMLDRLENWTHHTTIAGPVLISRQSDETS